MTIIKCDRCRKEFTSKQSEFQIVVTSQQKGVDVNFDLCEPCFRKVLMEIKGQNKDGFLC